MMAFLFVLISSTCLAEPAQARLNDRIAELSQRVRSADLMTSGHVEAKKISEAARDLRTDILRLAMPDGQGHFFRNQFEEYLRWAKLFNRFVAFVVRYDARYSIPMLPYERPIVAKILMRHFLEENRLEGDQDAVDIAALVNWKNLPIIVRLMNLRMSEGKSNFGPSIVDLARVTRNLHARRLDHLLNIINEPAFPILRDGICEALLGR